MKTQISSFAIHVKDMKKALEFYHDKMGFEIEYESDDWSQLKLNDNISLALHRTNQPGAGIGFVVENCREATDKLAQKDVKG